jgi:hypothetical protein
VLSLKLDDVEKVRSWLEENGAKIVFQTVASSPLFVLRERQVERIIKKGDVSELMVIYARKQRQVERIIKKGDVSELMVIYAQKQRGPPGSEIHQEERRVEK